MGPFRPAVSHFVLPKEGTRERKCVIHVQVSEKPQKYECDRVILSKGSYSLPMRLVWVARVTAMYGFVTSVLAVCDYFVVGSRCFFASFEHARTFCGVESLWTSQMRENLKVRLVSTKYLSALINAAVWFLEEHGGATDLGTPFALVF